VTLTRYARGLASAFKAFAAAVLGRFSYAYRGPLVRFHERLVANAVRRDGLRRARLLNILAPVELGRYPQFDYVFRQLGDASHKRILDLASQSLGCLSLGDRFPSSDVTYLSINEEEKVYIPSGSAGTLNLHNVRFTRADATCLPFDD